MILFDLETAPVAPEVYTAFKPTFEAPGNLKDPLKIAAAIAEKESEWLDRLALSPITGKILAIGYQADDDDAVTLLHGEDEFSLLVQFLSVSKDIYNGPLIGWNIKGFDIPFLIRRLWHHRLTVPKWWTAKPGWGKEPMVVDLMEDWKCGDYKATHTKLDDAARFLGLAGKTGAHAKDFGTLYLTDKQTALDYLERDVEMVKGIHTILYP